MNKNIVLIGLMGAGKSSVGKLLAEKLSYDFIDTDEYIEKQEQCAICDIFSNHGESYFRTLETNLISKLSDTYGKIISTGGGSVENPENLNNLKKTGIVVYLKATPSILFERIKADNTRPLLKNNNPLQTLENLLQKREQNYLKANFVIDTTNKSITDITDEILRINNENN